MNGEVVFSNSEEEVYKRVTGSVTKQTGQEKHTIPGTLRVGTSFPPTC